MLWPTLVEAALQRGYRAPRLEGLEFPVGPGEEKQRKRRKRVNRKG